MTIAINSRIEHWCGAEPVVMHLVEHVGGEVISGEPNWSRQDYLCQCGELISVLLRSNSENDEVPA